MLELFAGSVSADYILNQLTYREAVSIRNARIKRKIKENEEEEELRKKEFEAQQRMAARNKIVR